MTQRDFGQRRCREQKKPPSGLPGVGLLIAGALTVIHMCLWFGGVITWEDFFPRQERKSQIEHTQIMKAEPVDDDEIAGVDSIDVFKRVLLRLATDAGKISKADQDGLTAIIEGELK